MCIRATIMSSRNICLGNVRRRPAEDLVRSEKQRRFGQAKSDTLPEYCRKCPVLFACYGECPRNRFIKTPAGEDGLNYLCAGYKAFFTHIEMPMRQMADLLRQGRYADEIMQRWASAAHEQAAGSLTYLNECRTPVGVYAKHRADGRNSALTSKQERYGCVAPPQGPPASSGELLGQRSFRRCRYARWCDADLRSRHRTATGRPPGNAARPDGQPFAAPRPVSRDGTYAGTAVPLDTFGGACTSTMRVEGFHVTGNSVRFGQYRGTIDGNNGLQMVYRGTWIVGQFEGDNFQGQVDSMGRFAPGCTFSMTLQRVGP